MSDGPRLNREKERGNLESLRKKTAEQMKLDDEEPWGEWVKEKGPKRGGRGKRQREGQMCLGKFWS